MLFETCFFSELHGVTTHKTPLFIVHARWGTTSLLKQILKLSSKRVISVPFSVILQKKCNCTMDQKQKFRTVVSKSQKAVEERIKFGGGGIISYQCVIRMSIQAIQYRLLHIFSVML
jgi:hypothetical protein